MDSSTVERDKAQCVGVVKRTYTRKYYITQKYNNKVGLNLILHK